MAIKIEVLDRDQTDDLLWESWLTLLPGGRWSFFLHPDWCRALWESYHAGSRVRFHVAYDGGGIVGILPTCHRRMNKFGLFLPIAETFGGGRGDYSLPMAGGVGGVEVLEPLLESAVARSKPSGALVLPNLPDPSGAPEQVQDYLEKRGLTFERRIWVTQSIPLAGTFEETERGFTSRLRSDLRRREKRLREAHGPVTFRVIESQHEALKRLPDLFEMHDKRWLTSGLPGTFSDPAARAFYERVVRHLWEDGVHFSVLECGGRIIAFHLGFVWDGHLLYYKPTFESDLQAFSPGKLLLKYLVMHGVEEGWSGIDLLQGEEDFKRPWTSESTATSTFTIRTSRRSPTYWWLTRGRPLAERTLGRTYNRWATRLESLRKR
ncbi:GNAT family N-acetyltransferase [Gemmatimonadota bacterium]